eukprot:CAMPEP_0119406960 /NCGR_PEP_ID=MMETSP1335-20130426/1077_1 /TAXON_ID=259385 /ORGANISM="Chrysoculter rhomboideus, Strain RCC1486" /LENGTH=173 /DNA_ID=CAMNT_0007431053 /DNA_START=232 /DNA_END=752 /DNA_ORIENTATION=+
MKRPKDPTGAVCCAAASGVLCTNTRNQRVARVVNLHLDAVLHPAEQKRQQTKLVARHAGAGRSSEAQAHDDNDLSAAASILELIAAHVPDCRTSSLHASTLARSELPDPTVAEVSLLVEAQQVWDDRMIAVAEGGRRACPLLRVTSVNPPSSILNPFLKELAAGATPPCWRLE